MPAYTNFTSNPLAIQQPKQLSETTKNAVYQPSSPLLSSPDYSFFTRLAAQQNPKSISSSDQLQPKPSTSTAPPAPEQVTLKRARPMVSCVQCALHLNLKPFPIESR